MEREACVCDHGFERSDLCAEIIIIIIIMLLFVNYPTDILGTPLAHLGNLPCSTTYLFLHYPKS